MRPNQRKRHDNAHPERRSERFMELEHRLTTVEVTLWGQSGDNGIKSSLADLRRKMDMLLRFFWITTAIPAITVALLAILKFLGKL